MDIEAQQSLKTSYAKVNVWIAHNFFLHEKCSIDSVIFLEIYFSTHCKRKKDKNLKKNRKLFQTLWYL